MLSTESSIYTLILVNSAYILSVYLSNRSCICVKVLSRHYETPTVSGSRHVKYWRSSGLQVQMAGACAMCLPHRENICVWTLTLSSSAFHFRSDITHRPICLLSIHAIPRRHSAHRHRWAVSCVILCCKGKFLLVRIFFFLKMDVLPCIDWADNQEMDNYGQIINLYCFGITTLYLYKENGKNT